MKSQSAPQSSLSRLLWRACLLRGKATAAVATVLVAICTLAAPPLAQARTKPALASAPAVTPAATPVVAQQQIVRSFEDLGSPRQSLQLEGITAAYSFSIPVSSREAVRSGRLHLETVNSTALLAGRSEISVSLNGRVLAQYRLDPENTRGVHDIELPAEALVPGYAEVRINVVQHYTDKCENPLSPELWTRIDGSRSYVALGIDGQMPDLAPRLTQLSRTFDRRGWLARRLAVVTGTDGLNEAQLSAAALVVQGLSLRLDYRALGVDVLTAARAAAADEELGQFSGMSMRIDAGAQPATQGLTQGRGPFPGLSQKVYAGRDVLLVGKRAELSRYLSQELYGMVSGAFVGVFPANAGDSVVIVVSGSTDEELLQAARSLANPEFKFSDMAMERASASTLPVPKILLPGARVTLDTLGFRTTTLSALRRTGAVVEFRVPGEYTAKPNDAMSLSLHLSYSAGLRKASTVGVYLNGTFMQSVALDVEQGADLPQAIVKLPAQSLKPGYNTLSFEPLLLVGSETCDQNPADRGTLTLFEDSSLGIPDTTSTAQAPDLDRFAKSFWPYAGPLNVVLTNRSSDTASVGLELLALMAQKNRAAFEPVVSFSVPATGHALVVGPFEGLADVVTKSWPLQQYGWVAEGSHVGVLQAVQGGRVLTGFFAQNSATLRKGVELLRTKGFWNSLAGTAVVIDTQEQSFRVEKARMSPDQESFGQSSVWADWRVGWALGALALSLLAMAAAYGLRQWIRRRQHRQASAAPQDSAP